MFSETLDLQFLDVSSCVTLIPLLHSSVIKGCYYRLELFVSAFFLLEHNARPLAIPKVKNLVFVQSAVGQYLLKRVGSLSPMVLFGIARYTPVGGPHRKK